MNILFFTRNGTIHNCLLCDREYHADDVRKNIHFTVEKANTNYGSKLLQNNNMILLFRNNFQEF